MDSAKSGLAILGFGSFGQFMARHLKSHFDVVVWDIRPLQGLAAEIGVRWGEPAELAAQPIVVHAVPVQVLEEVLESIVPMLSSGTLFVDVASVKVRPMELLEQRLPADVEYVGLHPMFGPQSGRDGIEGLKVALCSGRSSRVDCLKGFLTDTLGLDVLEMSPEVHDRQIAYVQGLTHWMAKALRAMSPPEVTLSTPAFQHLMKIEEILGEDSWELFVTIQRENPFAREARAELLAELAKLERRLRGEPGEHQ